MNIFLWKWLATRRVVYKIITYHVDTLLYLNIVLKLWSHTYLNQHDQIKKIAGPIDTDWLMFLPCLYFYDHLGYYTIVYFKFNKGKLHLHACFLSQCVKARIELNDHSLKV